MSASESCSPESIGNDTIEPFYDSGLFVSNPPDNLICALCKGVFHNPLSLSCSHTFCGSCLTQCCQSDNNAHSAFGSSADSNQTHQSSPSVSHSSSSAQSIVNACPTCRVPFSMSLMTCNRTIQQIIANLEVRCPNSVRGCRVAMSMGLNERNVIAHRMMCSFEIVACRYAPDCTMMMPRGEIEVHELTTCDERLICCEHCCELVRFSKWKQHHESLLGCTNIIVCPNGCDLATKADVDDTSNIIESGISIAEVEQAVKILNISSVMDDQLTFPGGSLTTVSSASVGVPSVERTTLSYDTPTAKGSNKTHQHHDVLRRSELASHLEVCPLQMVVCDLCSNHVLRRDIPNHISSALTSHFIELQRHMSAERSAVTLLRTQVIQARSEASEARRVASEIMQQVKQGPLFAYYFDIKPVSMLCSHYVSNEFMCGDHVFYFALHRHIHSFSAYLYLKSGSTPVALSFVVTVKARITDYSLRSTDDLSSVENVSDASLSVASLSYVPRERLSALELKLDVKFDTFEGKGVRNWFTLAELRDKGGYNDEEDAITIGLLIKNHSSDWIYHSSSHLV